MNRTLRRLFAMEIEVLRGLLLLKGQRSRRSRVQGRRAKGNRRANGQANGRAKRRRRVTAAAPACVPAPAGKPVASPRSPGAPSTHIGCHEEGAGRPGAWGELLEGFRDARRLLSRNSSRLLSAALSLGAHAAVLAVLWHAVPEGGGAPEPEPFQVVLRRDPPPRALPPVEERRPSPPSPGPAAAPTPAPPTPETPASVEPVPKLPEEPPQPAPEPSSSTGDDPEAPEDGAAGTGTLARLEPEGSPGPPTVLGVGVSPPGSTGRGRGGDGEGDGWGSRTRGKPGALKIHGGTGGTEDAVSKGLRWLAAHQDPDGGWSAYGFVRHCRGFTSCRGMGIPTGQIDVGVTALALLAFLGAGEAPGGSGAYANVVERGLDKILSCQRAEGALGAEGERFMYNHAIASLALVEAYGITRNTRYLKPAMAALEFSTRSQQAGGGWDYTDAPTGRNDLSISGWQAMAFKAAEAAGLPVTETTLRRFRSFLEACSVPGGEAVYAQKGIGAGRRGINMTAVALFSKLYLGVPPEDSWIQQAADRLLLHPPDPSLVPHDWDRHFQSSYYWYSATLALFHLGGARWEAWNHFLKKEILPLQSTVPHEEGSWDADGNWLGGMGGRVFTTAMNVLTFEVYYRYPPLHVHGRRTPPGRQVER